MTDVPILPCGLCGSEAVYTIGHPRHRRKLCLDCKGQHDGDGWHTAPAWEIRTNCGSCRHRPDGCEGCQDFDKWETDDMEGDPLPEGWTPPFWKEFRCRLPGTDERHWSEWLPMSKYEADPDCDYEFR
jgi:hypothetical protein